jgi:hypothetical protein
MYDHGWDMPDQRATYYVYGPIQHYDDCEEPEDCDCDEREVDKTITVVIERVWKECECEMGSDYDCRYSVKVNGSTECSFDSEHKADTYISIAYPKAEAPEPDPDWESERWLRRAEGWGY